MREPDIYDGNDIYEENDIYVRAVIYGEGHLWEMTPCHKRCHVW
jgi:hypothetical protein